MLTQSSPEKNISENIFYPRINWCVLENLLNSLKPIKVYLQIHKLCNGAIIRSSLEHSASCQHETPKQNDFQPKNTKFLNTLEAGAGFFNMVIKNLKADATFIKLYLPLLFWKDCRYILIFVWEDEACVSSWSL